MFKFIAGVFISVVFALWIEFFYKFGATFNPKAFYIAIPIYFVYIILLHLIFLKLYKLPSIGTFLLIIFGGFFGLLIEWYMLGNSPSGNPNASQLGMFIIHSVYPSLGFIVARNYFKNGLLKKLFYYMLVSTLIVTSGYIIQNNFYRFVWFIYSPIVLYIGLYYFIIRFSRVEIK